MYEKRFILRQLLAIYNSKFIEPDIKLDILNLLTEICKFKYSLVDLIKRHYFVVWLTNSFKLCADLNEFFKLLEIYIMIWNQIMYDGNNSEPNDAEERMQIDGLDGTEPKAESKAPVLFLNQMFVLMLEILQKFDSKQTDIKDLKGSPLESRLIENFFKNAAQLLYKLNERDQKFQLNSMCLKRLFRILDLDPANMKLKMNYLNLLLKLNPSANGDDNNLTFLLNFISDLNFDFNSISNKRNIFVYLGSNLTCIRNAKYLLVNLIEFLSNIYRSHSDFTVDWCIDLNEFLKAFYVCLDHVQLVDIQTEQVKFDPDLYYDLVLKSFG